MGCGVSKFGIEEDGAASPCHQLSPVHRRNDRAVADISLLSKPLPEGGEGEDHAKGDAQAQHKNIKKVNSEACDKEESDEDGHDKDDGIEYPRSLSFRVYCVPSFSDDDNNEDHSNAGQTMDNRQGDVQNNEKGSGSPFLKQGSSNRMRRRGRIGKGIKTGSAKVKSILRV